jgi:hypothetical protein
MLSNKKKMEISLVCHAAVGNMMATMSNPKYRGDNFTWERFPEMMAGYCQTQVFMCVPMPERLKKNCQAYAEQTGREIAASWVKTMTE